MRSGLGLACVLALGAAAGCVSPFASAPDEAPFAAQREAFLHSTMTLAARPETDTHAVASRPFYQAWAAGDDYPTWLMDPLGEDVLVTKLDVTLYVRATGPVVESVRFPDIMVYAGSGEAWMGYGERRDFSAFQPDEVHEVAFEIALPAGGLWLPPEAPLGLKVVPVMLQQEQSNLEILVGGETPSRAAFTLARTEVRAAAEEAGARRGEVTGTVYAAQAAPPTTSQRTPVEVPLDAPYLLAWMNTTSNVGVPDIDLSLEGPEGTLLAGSGTPTPREALRLASVNLAGPGEYQLVVTTAGSPRAEYQLEWRVGQP